MSDCNIKDLQNGLLNIMKEFHEVCVKHNLKYYLIGESMLGAIRHKGFIPWDDDIDVGMPRKDYEKLLSLPKSIWLYNLQLNTPYITDYWIVPFVKLVDTK